MTAAPARRDGALTLAESFELLQRAMAELRTPVSHDKVRARMVALLGREDPLLDADRFGRLLRQANDAEVADVRKTGDDKFELSPHRSQRLAHAAAAAAAPAAERVEVAAPPAEPARPSRPERKGRGDRGARGSRAVPAESAPEPAPVPEPQPPAPDPARRVAAGLRFRRGSRGPVRSADIPLVGAVKMEPEVVVREERPKPEGRTRPKPEARKPKASRPKTEPAAAAKAAPVGAAAKSPRRGGRGRGRSKAAATAE